MNTTLAIKTKYKALISQALTTALQRALSQSLFIQNNERENYHHWCYKTREESAESLGLFTLLQTLFFSSFLLVSRVPVSMNIFLFTLPGFFRRNLKETSTGGREGEREREGERDHNNKGKQSGHIMQKKWPEGTHFLNIFFCINYIIYNLRMERWHVYK